MKTIIIIDPIINKDLYKIQKALNDSSNNNKDVEDLHFLLINTSEPTVYNFCYNRLEELGHVLLTKFPENDFIAKPINK